jgi:protein O-mannosyl-transferase
LEHALAALNLDPGSPDAHYNVGTVLFLQGKLQEAVAHYRAACKANPAFAEAYLNGGKALLTMNNLSEAENSLREALRCQPDNIQAHQALVQVYAGQKRAPEQAREYAEMLRLRPDWPEVQNNLAWLLATHPNAEVRDGPRAVSLAERACALTQRTNLSLLSTLAAAYAEAGRFAEAVSAQQGVCDLAAAQAQTNQAQAFQTRLELYRSGHAYHRP